MAATGVKERPVRTARGGGKRRRAEQARRRKRLLVTAIAAIGVIGLVLAAVLLGSAGRSASVGDVTVDGPILTRTHLVGPGDVAPSFTAPMLGGGSRTLAEDLQGPAMLAFWAPWCPACEQEMPVVEALSREYPDVAFRSVSIWADDRPGPTTEDFVRTTGVTFPTYLDDGTHTIADAFGVVGTPSLVLVDADLNVLQADSGVIPEDVLRTWLEGVG